MPPILSLRVSRLPFRPRTEAFVLATLEVTGARPTRRPLDLFLLLDRSSSMRGERLFHALEAAKAAAARLTDQDRLCLIAFDAEAEVLLPPLRMEPAYRRFALQRLDRLTPGRGTNYSGALRETAAALRADPRPGTLTRAVLLTDGYPSVGELDPTRLAHAAARLRSLGASLSCAGFGEGYDANLLTELSESADGQFHDVARPEGIPAVVRREVDGLLEAALTDVTVEFHPGPSIEHAALVHPYPATRLTNGLAAHLGELGLDSPRSVLFRTDAHETLGRLVAHGQGQPTGYREEVELQLGHDDPAPIAQEWLTVSLAQALIEGWDALRHGRGAARARFEAAVALAEAVEQSAGLDPHPLGQRLQESIGELDRARSLEHLRARGNEDTAVAHRSRVCRVGV